MSAADASPDSAEPRRAQGTVRRLIVFTILFVLVAIAASGFSGLLGRIVDTRPDVAGGPAGLALSLAFALIGGTLAVIVWWFVWRRLDGPERSSLAWGLYLAAMSTVALVTSTVSLLGAASDAVVGRWSPDALATGITWLAVWILHRLMLAHPKKRPLRLATVPAVLGSAYGLILGASAAIGVLSALLGEALWGGDAGIGRPWWSPLLQGLVWAAGGTLVWWWHWVRERAATLTSGFAHVVLVVTGVLLAAATAIGGSAVVVFVLLRALTDRSEPWRELWEPLPWGLAAAAIGWIVWLYHRRVALDRSAAVHTATHLVEAGIGLVAAAAGVGVVVNALLAAVTTPLAGAGSQTLLLGGIASILVGAPLWWLAWRPRSHSAEASSSGRRVYLVAVFGASAVVAIVAVLFVGYRLFEYALDPGGESLIERIRAPFGLLVATALVAAYHYAVWRRERALAPALARESSLERVFLVTGAGGADAARAVHVATGAAVTHWERADAAGALIGADGSVATDTVVGALEGITARRALVVTGGDGGVEVIPLAD